MPSFKLYNFLTRKKEVFKPLKKGGVGLYTCGPTVYNYAHIGNFRAYIFEDILQRTLEHSGYKVKKVMNITDVDDKTIRDSKVAGKSLEEFTKYYTDKFFKDLQRLNIKEANVYPRATEHIKEMISLVKVLLKKKIAYKTEDGVYFDISKFKKYGRLSLLKKREIKAGARISSDEYEKGSAEDFVLWKAKKGDEPSWSSPWGDGRPGWHLECSAMSMKYLGKTFDIHAGGIDLIFPHHENEIAQSEAATEKKFVKYFIEGEHLLVDGKKMSKSLGNVFNLDDLKNKSADPLAFRYLILSAHYRTQLNFTWESLQGAQNSLERLKKFVLSLQQNLAPKNRLTLPRNKSELNSAARVHAYDFYSRGFVSAISNDLDTPKALAIIWSLVNAFNKSPEKFDANSVLDLLYKFDEVLALGLKDIHEEQVPKVVQEMLNDRELARKTHNFTAADILRQKIAKLGWGIQDMPDGPRLKKL